MALQNYIGKSEVNI